MSQRSSQRLPLTLIEVLVALTLASWLLTSVVFVISALWRIPLEISDMRRSILFDQQLWRRLEDSVGQMRPLQEVKDAEGGLSYDGHSLLFHAPKVGGHYQQGLLSYQLAVNAQQQLVLRCLTEGHEDEQLWCEDIEAMAVELLRLPHTETLYEDEQCIYGSMSRWASTDPLPHACWIELRRTGGSCLRYPVWVQQQSLIHLLSNPVQQPL